MNMVCLRGRPTLKSRKKRKKKIRNELESSVGIAKGIEKQAREIRFNVVEKTGKQQSFLKVSECWQQYHLKKVNQDELGKNR